MSVSLKQFCQIWWRETCKKVKKAVVFIDNESAECLHWNGGIMEFMNSGAIAVKEFSSFEGGNENEKKAVFITSSPIYEKTKTILKDVISNSRFEYCILITAAHPTVHQFAKFHGFRESSNEMSIFHSLEEEMLHWMGNMNFTVEIFYFPLFIVPFTETFFLTPPFNNFFPMTDLELVKIPEIKNKIKRISDGISSEILSSIDFSSFNLDVQVKTLHFVSCLHSLLNQLDIKEDIFSMGYLSGLIASNLESLPAAINRRKSASNKASLILIDRTLDLSSVTTHSSDSVLDRILDVLPRLPGHCNDVAVNMSPLSYTKVKDPVEEITLAPGCLAHPNKDLCPQVLDWLIHKKQRDVLSSLHNHLATLAPGRNDEKATKLSIRVTPQNLEKMIIRFHDNNTLIYEWSGFLEQCLAVSQTLRSPRNTVIETLISLEKLLVQSILNNSGDETLTQLAQLILTRNDRNLSLVDILTLMVYIYSIIGPEVVFSDTESNALESALRQALIEDREVLPNWLIELVDTIKNDAAFHILNKLQSISRTRKDSNKYKSLIESHGSLMPPTTIGLIQKFLEELFDPSKPDISGLTCRNSGLKDMIKTGFSKLLMLPRQQHPLDNPQVIIIIVGGISAMEVKKIQEAITSKAPNLKFLIGATKLLSPTSSLQSVLDLHYNNSE